MRLLFERFQNLTFRNTLEISNENGWLASVNDSISEFDCIPNVHCENWKYQNGGTPGSVSSLDNDIIEADQFGFLRTTPWQRNYFPPKKLQLDTIDRMLIDLPEFKTDGSDDFISPAIPLELAAKRPGQVALGFSILGEEVQILLSGDADWENKPGIIVQLGSRNNEWVASCSKINKNVTMTSCKNVRDI
jgi:hypothetical protein